MPGIVRAATAADLPALLALERWAGKEGGVCYSREDFVRAIASSAYYKAVLECGALGVVGYLIAHPRRHRLVAVVVRPEDRRGGLGTRLLRAALRRDPHLTATAREKDLVAQKFLGRNRFVCTAIFQKAFTEPPDAGYFFQRLRVFTTPPASVREAGVLLPPRMAAIVP